METGNQLRHGSHCVFLMHVHWVFVTKYRRGVFTAQILHDLRSIFTGVCSDFESQRVEFDGEDDPVHLLVNYPPKIAVAALVNSLKRVSSRLIRLKTTRASDACYGVSRCGPQATSLEAAGAPNRRHPTIHRAAAHASLSVAEDAFSVRAILPRPEGRACRVSGSTQARFSTSLTMATSQSTASLVGLAPEPAAKG
jgi:putative transposase